VVLDLQKEKSKRGKYDVKFPCTRKNDEGAREWQEGEKMAQPKMKRGGQMIK